MARRFLSAIKLLTGSTPPAGTAGDTFFDTDTKTIQVHDGTAWVNSAVRATDGAIGGRVFTGDTTPTSPVQGDLWVDSSGFSAGANILRWRKTAAGGETSLSGLDDLSTTLSYTAGYELVHLNGVLQVRGVDYVATTGTTITGLTALVVDDVVDVIAHRNMVYGDYYTQSQADTKFTITGGATTIATEGLLPSRALVSNASGKVVVSSITDTEIGHLYGVTSAIQTQINSKAPTASPTFSGDMNAYRIIADEFLTTDDAGAQDDAAFSSSNGQSGMYFVSSGGVVTGVRFTVAGTVRYQVTSAGGANVSTITTKDNVQTYSVPIEDLLKIRTISYHPKGDEREDIIAFGVIAEELDEIPSLRIFLDYEEDGSPISVQYDRIALAYLGVIKDQQERIESLEQRLTELENKE